MAKRSRTEVTSPAEPGDWAMRLGFYIHDTSRLRKLYYDAIFRPAGVTRAQAWVMSYLWTQDELTQSELAARLDLGKVALGSLIDKLETAGMVERRTDPEDRRAKRVALTPRGRDTLTHLRSLTAEASRTVLAGLSESEIEATARVLKKMKTNLLGSLGGDADDGDAA